MKRVRRSERGVTLVEVIVAGAAGATVLGLLGATVAFQQESYREQLSYLEAQQNARASISILKRYIRMAGWGTTFAVDRAGPANIGQCYDNTDDREWSDTCDNVDNDGDGNPGHDRLRVLAMSSLEQHGPTFTPDNEVDSSGNYYGVAADLTTDQAYGDGSYVVLSGSCASTNPETEFLIVNQSAEGSLLGSGYSGAVNADYDFDGLPTGSHPRCSYDPGFGLSRAMLADFFIDRSDSDHPELKLRLGADQSVTDAHTVAWDVDDLQVRYGIDTGDTLGATTPDGVIDAWCDDPSVPVNATNCADILNPTPVGHANAENFNRIIAVQVAVVPRTREPDEDKDTGGSDLTVQNHTFTGADDGHKRWIYRATVALRNVGQ